MHTTNDNGERTNEPNVAHSLFLIMKADTPRAEAMQHEMIEIVVAVLQGTPIPPTPCLKALRAELGT